MARIVLVGSPNAGKSTLFNRITGLSARTMNFPGSTMQIQRGHADGFEIVDTPGLYSLYGSREDEKVTYQFLQQQQYQKLVLVLDVTQLRRQLNLFFELRQFLSASNSAVELVIVFTMMDLAQRVGSTFDVRELSTILQVPCYPAQDWSVGFMEQERSSSHLLDGASTAEQEALLTSASPSSESILKQLDIRLQSQQQALEQGFELWSLRADRWFLHPWWGGPIFAGLLFLVFAALFWMSDPLIGGVEALFTWGSELVESGPAFWGQGFLAQALIPSVGAFMVFVPQIAILFFILTFLEGSGYFARGVVILDRFMRQLGLSGRAFLPMVAGFACAIPAILATRQLATASERRQAQWLIPLLPCSARLPVFVFLIQALLPESSAVQRTLALFAVYGLSLALAFLAAKMLMALQPPSAAPMAGAMMLDLPWYRWPSAFRMLKEAFERSISFVTRAGPVIFGLSLVMWVLGHYPSGDLQGSYLDQFAQTLAPIFAPLGVDGRVGLAVLSAFVAREVFVSTLELAASFAGPSLAPVAEASALISTPSAWALLIFFVIALQCLSTVAIQAKEGAGRWPFALIQLVVFNLVAYVLAVGCYQVLTLWN